MRASVASVGARGIDTIEELTEKNCEDLKKAGYDFVCGYLGSMTPRRLAIILGASLAFMPITYARKPGWIPSPGMGAEEGANAVKQCKALGIPLLTTVWVDLEGVARGVDSKLVVTWVDQKAGALKAVGYLPGLYVGADNDLSVDELTETVPTRYWHSCSRVQEPKVGFCMYQCNPPNQIVCGVQVDINFIQSDYLDRRPNWVIA